VSNGCTVLSIRPFVADEKETEHQIRSREARIEALEAALRARDRQLDALIAQSLERSGIALMGPAIGASADADALETALPRRSSSVPPT
jgi:septal ring factor EnvC (AmiA/AmiB activator)